MKSTIVLGIGATLLASCSGNKQKTEEKVTQRQKPNVIFLIADDIGYGDLSCNGSKTIHTPNVEKLAAQGVRFTDAHAVAATSTPSRYSLFTGHYAWRRNDTGIAAGNAGMVIRPEQPTVADMFRECGYTTGAIGKWHLGLSDRTGGQDWNGLITPGPSDIGSCHGHTKLSIENSGCTSHESYRDEHCHKYAGTRNDRHGNIAHGIFSRLIGRLIADG